MRIIRVPGWLRQNNAHFEMCLLKAWREAEECDMIEGKWTHLSGDEATIILNALSSVRSSQHADIAKIDTLIGKLEKADSQPDITIGICRGQVCWARGNPFPIRICDYDGFDLPDVDERGKPCEITWEPADNGDNDT